MMAVPACIPRPISDNMRMGFFSDAALLLDEKAAAVLSSYAGKLTRLAPNYAARANTLVWFNSQILHKSFYITFNPTLTFDQMIDSIREIRQTALQALCMSRCQAREKSTNQIRRIQAYQGETTAKISNLQHWLQGFVESKELSVIEACQYDMQGLARSQVKLENERLILQSKLNILEQLDQSPLVLLSEPPLSSSEKVSKPSFKIEEVLKGKWLDQVHALLGGQTDLVSPSDAAELAKIDGQILKYAKEWVACRQLSVPFEVIFVHDNSLSEDVQYLTDIQKAVFRIFQALVRVDISKIERKLQIAQDEALECKRTIGLIQTTMKTFPKAPGDEWTHNQWLGEIPYYSDKYKLCQKRVSELSQQINRLKSFGSIID